MIERFFQLRERGTTVSREVTGGLTTFATLAYIVFVQPVVMNAAGMDLGSAMVATCLASAAATFLMGLTANYPIALAPGMGHNFFFTYIVVLTLGYSWQEALGATFVSGLLFLILCLVGFQEKLIEAIPSTLKHAIAVGIGLLVAMVGLQWSGLVVDTPGTLVGLGDVTSPAPLLAILGLTVTIILMARGVGAAILGGLLAGLAAGLSTGMIQYQGMVGSIPSLEPTLFQLDPLGALEHGMLSIIFVFFLLDLFDTVGTLIGVSEEAGLLRDDGRLPRARPALISDAVGTLAGALMGTSTITSYVESAAGVSAGARTGLANMVTGTLFLLSVLLAPLVRMIGGGIEAGEGTRLYPVVAPALVVVGSLMIRNIRRIHWDDFTETLPAFLTMIMMPLTFSITEGIAFGFISYALLKIATGRVRETSPLLLVLSVLFLMRYIFLPLL